MEASVVYVILHFTCKVRSLLRISTFCHWGKQGLGLNENDYRIRLILKFQILVSI